MPPLSAPKAPTFRELQSFLRVVELGSYTATAQALGTSPARVWQSVESLESKLGFAAKTLMRPAGQGGKIVPTPVGRFVAAAAEEAMEAMIALRDQASAAHRGERLELRLASYPAHVEQFLAGALASFRVMFPDVPVKLHGLTDEARRSGGLNLLAELAAGRVDLAIAPSRDESGSRLVQYPLYSWQLMAGFVTRRTESVSIEELRGQPVLLSPRGFRSRRMFEEACTRSGFEPRVYVDSSNTEALIALGAAGLGVPIIPSDAINRATSLTWVPVGDVDNEWLGGSYSVFTLHRGASESEREGSSQDLLEQLTLEVIASAEPLRSRFVG